MSKGSSDAQALFRRSRELLSKGLTSEAVDSGKEALEKSNNHPVYWANYADCLLEAGRFDDASKAARNAVNLEPTNPNLWTVAGRAEAYRENYHEAARMFQKSVDLEENADVLTLLAAVQSEFDKGSALRNAERALELRPCWEEAQQIAEKLRVALGLRSDGG